MQLVKQYELYFTLIGSLVMYYQLIVHGFAKYGAVHRAQTNRNSSAGNLKVEATQECFSIYF